MPSILYPTVLLFSDFIRFFRIPAFFHPFALVEKLADAPEQGGAVDGADGTPDDVLDQ